MVSTVNFDHACPAVSAELFDWGQRLQQESPIAYSEAHGGFWIVSRHEDIVSITLDQKNFINSQGITLPPIQAPVPVIPLESDPPLHIHYRSVLMPFLGAKYVGQYEGKIRAIIGDALDALIAHGEGDAVADFAALIPTRAMAFVFGFSDEDAYRFDRDFGAVIDAASSGDAVLQGAAVERFKSFLLELLEARRADPSGNDIVSAMLRHQIDGRALTEQELLGLLWSAAGGAVDTTKLAIGHAVHALGVNRAVRRLLIEDPTLIPAAIEESLRLNAPAFMTSRLVNNPVSLGGVDMKPGDRVLMVFGWANREEAMFACPHQMNLERASNKHLTFGHGVHKCAGMHLARLELRVALEELLARIPDYELVNPEQGPILHGGLMWGFDSLPIRLNADR